MGVGRGRGVDVPGVGEEAKRGVRASGQALERGGPSFSATTATAPVFDATTIEIHFAAIDFRAKVGIMVSLLCSFTS